VFYDVTYVSTTAETSTQRQVPTTTTKVTSTQRSTSTSAVGPNAIPRTGSSSDSADSGLSGTEFLMQHTASNVH